MQMRYCLKWQSNINFFHVCVSLAVLGASPNPEIFQWFFVNILLLHSLVSFESCALSLCNCVGCAMYALRSRAGEYMNQKPCFSPSEVYDIQGNLQDGSQVVVSVIFENKCDSFLKSMEFNVLDSLNSKLQRPEGSGPHDGLTVPFQLPPGQWFSTNFVCNEWAHFRNAELYTVFILIM